MKIGVSLLFLALGVTLSANGQGVPASDRATSPAMIPAGASSATSATTNAQEAAPAIPVPSTIPGAAGREVGQLSVAAQTLLGFRPMDVKFDVADLMDILRDRRHEGWVLAAYPDPKTGQPLIGAGFSLDLPERVHPQRDALNPSPFLEPSSADLWQAAGLEPAKLKNILDEFYARRAEWSKRAFRRQIFSLEPQITNEDADALLRIGIIQSIDNAKAYCRNFDRLSASQQMAMTQLVYQMGVNLEEFSSFLTLVNKDSALSQALDTADREGAQYWRDVQLSLVQSQWARLYRQRATTVIAMLDPRYADDPSGAEHSIARILHPVRQHRGRGRLRSASYTHHRSSAARRRARKMRKE